MSGVTYPLIAEGAHKSGALVGLRPDTTADGKSETQYPNYVPAVDSKLHKMYRRLTFTVSVIGTTGTAPTSWSLGARFEKAISHTTAYWNEFPTWAPFELMQIESAIAEGDCFGSVDPVGWGIIASSTSVPDFATSGTLPSGLSLPEAASTTPKPTLITTRVTMSRTVTDLMDGVRLRLNPALVGGDSTTKILASITVAGVR